MWVILDIYGSIGTERSTCPFSLTSELPKTAWRGLEKEQEDHARLGRHQVGEVVIKISPGPALSLSDT